MHLCIGYSTLRHWLRKYKDKGFKSLIKVLARGKPKSLITPKLHQILEDKLKDSEHP
jgi:transposase